MASLRRFPKSPFWFDCFNGPDARRVQRSTKEINKRRAQRIADQYEAAALEARLGLLSERQARKIIGEIFEISNRQKLPNDSIGDFFRRWLESVKNESNEETYPRYSGIIEQ